MKHIVALILIAGLSACGSLAHAPLSSARQSEPGLADCVDARALGVQGNGVSDDTAALQRALDAMSKHGGGTVKLGRGSFLFKSHLNVPNNVTLTGLFTSVPAHNGLRDKGLPKPGEDGTTLLVTEGAGSETGPAFITLNTNSTLKGVVIYYPGQKIDATPEPYPYAVAMRGKNPALLECELLNPYNGIDASQNERHLIRDISGQPLRRGVFVDAIYDIGRIENVHFNPWWSMSPKVRQFQFEQGEAFIFARTDWQYVFNTFAFGYKVGYKFVKSGDGACNGNFLGIGADDCGTSLVLEECAGFGVMITNGEFVSFNGPKPTMVRAEPTNHGSMRFSNCAFWGAANHIADIAGHGTVGFSDCTFCPWTDPRKPEHQLPVIRCSGGSLLVRGCEFRISRPQVELLPGVTRAIITENLLAGPQRITNSAPEAQVIVRDNLSSLP